MVSPFEAQFEVRTPDPGPAHFNVQHRSVSLGLTVEFLTCTRKLVDGMQQGLLPKKCSYNMPQGEGAPASKGHAP